MQHSKANRVAWLGLVLVIMILGWFSHSVWAAPSIQLAIVLDGSTSINPQDFIAVKNGLADAIANDTIIPTTGR